MSINRNMKPYMLQKNIPVRSKSGASKEHWIDIGNIDIAIRQKDDSRIYASELYSQSTHSGLTYYKDIKKAVNRIVKDGVVYEILSVNSESRLTNLLLKVVE